MNKHKISWTDTTWNPLAGCTRASSGCDNCYAAAMALRLEAMAQADIAAGKDPGAKAKYIGVATRTGNGKAAFNGKINFDHRALDEPYTWKKPRMVFVNSMSDLFHKDVPDAFLDRVFQVMIENSQHTFQVLTKRAERMAQYAKAYHPHLNSHKHIWLGVSVENQDAADECIPHLLNVPAAVRFLSCEPLLSPLNLHYIEGALSGKVWPDTTMGRGGIGGQMITSEPAGIHWMICGGESGAHARPMNPQWVRWLRDDCLMAGIAFHFKQWGEWAPVSSSDEAFRMVSYGEVKQMHTFDDGHIVYRFGKHKAGRILDGRTWDQFPSVK